MANKIMMGIISITAALTLSACAGDNNEETTQNTNTQENAQTSETEGQMEGMDHSTMNHSSDGEIPEGLEEAANPTYPVGSTAIINADHMEGMDGAEATIVGAFDTTVYTVSYTPTNGGEPVTNHKWVIHEELEGVEEQPLEPGEEATINADHMEGMEGATATIDSADETTVYMVDYTSTTGEEVTNHKWVTESELSPAE
ncbi:YdhK family protein [Lysinibacillus fusiformis]|uniref:YdhK family protein n=1 Tax=Ureibacillus chungkukjangi TaxID=1202712 RepID=UPI000D3ABB85|nr:YdhK family protein [Ureibacillus chungkukjangi]MCM3389319.1 YdhK family protein [Ureibacillus chungkukjangi]MDI7743501.1 YdhK family protein [Lysinibacillus fusiformis]